MAITASGLYYLTFKSALDGTIALDLDLTTHKIALYNNTLTAPNFGTDTAFGVAPYNANEVTSGGPWPTGGVALGATAISLEATGLLVWDAGDVSVASTTLAAVRGGLIYADALAGNQAIVFINFVSDYSTNNGTFAITWATPASGGVFSIDLF